ncbi:hypothetical protein P8452_22535 [Trifolium repens]|nr:hypothetical protein P8452_22535 [Trifolium repens]
MKVKISVLKLNFDDVADLLPGNENVNIRVKVLRLWRVPAFFNHSETNSVEMVLIVDKGGKIHASIRKQLVSMFEGKIEEGERSQTDSQNVLRI